MQKWKHVKFVVAVGLVSLSHYEAQQTTLGEIHKSGIVVGHVYRLQMHHKSDDVILAPFSTVPRTQTCTNWDKESKWRS